MDERICLLSYCPVKAVYWYKQANQKTSFGATKAGTHVAKVLPTSIASLIVFLLVGIWHGASWKYVAFGIWNGGVIMLSNLLEPQFQALTRTMRIKEDALWFRLFQMFRTFVIVLVGYVFDIAPSFRDSISMFTSMLRNQNLAQFLGTVFSLG